MTYKQQIYREFACIGVYLCYNVTHGQGKKGFPPISEKVIDMTNVTTQTPVANLSQARNNVVKIAGKTGEVIKAYAVAMRQAFDLVDNQGNVTTAWFDLKGKLKAGVNDERKAFKAAMDAAGYSTAVADVYWQRVKEASGYVTAGNKVKGGPVDIDAKTMAELKTIINRILNAEDISTAQQSSKVKGLLIEAFEIMGGKLE